MTQRNLRRFLGHVTKIANAASVQEKDGARDEDESLEIFDDVAST